jgi:paraquat-inducible protein B
LLELPTIPSAFEKLTKSLENLPLAELVNKILSAVNGVDALVNSKQIQAMPVELDGLIKESKLLVSKLDKEIGPLLKRAEDTLGSYDKLARHVDSKVDPLAAEATKTLEKLDKALDQAKETLSRLERTAGPDSAAVSDLRRALNEISSMARSIRTLADFLERHPEALIQGKGPRR